MPRAWHSALPQQEKIEPMSGYVNGQIQNFLLRDMLSRAFSILEGSDFFVCDVKQIIVIDFVTWKL